MAVKKRLRKSYLRMFLIPMLSATLLLVLFIVLAVITAIAIPLSLSRQISDASAARQQVPQPVKLSALRSDGFACSALVGRWSGSILKAHPPFGLVQDRLNRVCVRY